MPLIAPLLIIGALLTACGQPIGRPCQFTGDGFTSRHDCASTCLARWSVRCPDGREVRAARCAGAVDCTPGSCPAGSLCYAFDDPFEDQRYCVPDDLCPGLDTAAGARWERAAATQAEATRAEWQRRSDRRRAITTQPATPTTDVPGGTSP